MSILDQGIGSLQGGSNLLLVVVRAGLCDSRKGASEFLKSGNIIVYPSSVVLPGC